MYAQKGCLNYECISHLISSSSCDPWGSIETSSSRCTGQASNTLLCCPKEIGERVGYILLLKVRPKNFNIITAPAKMWQTYIDSGETNLACGTSITDCSGSTYAMIQGTKLNLNAIVIVTTS